MNDFGQMDILQEQTERLVEGPTFHQPNKGWRRSACSKKQKNARDMHDLWKGSALVFYAWFFECLVGPSDAARCSAGAQVSRTVMYRHRMCLLASMR